jgi:hypothetical protein
MDHLPHPDTRRFSFTTYPWPSCGSFPSTACSSTWTRPLPCHPPSNWFRLFSGQTLSRINPPAYSTPVIPTGVQDELGLTIPPGSDFQSVLPHGHVISSRHAGWGGSGWIHLPCPLQSVCQRHASTSHHVELDLYADETTIIATSRNPTLLVSYLESHLNELQRWLSEWRIAINVSKSTTIIFARAGRRFIQPRPVTLFGEQFQWVDTTRYLGAILDTRFNWSPYVDQVNKKTAQMMGMLGPLLNKKNGLSVRNRVLLYKQLIRPMMDYVCPAWTSAARTHVRRLQ